MVSAIITWKIALLTIIQESDVTSSNYRVFTLHLSSPKTDVIVFFKASTRPTFRGLVGGQRMNGRSFIRAMGSACAVLIFLSTPTPTLADKVYKWVDENGKTHFGDRPQGPKAEKIPVRPASVGDPTAAGRLERTNKLLDSFAADRKKRTAERAAAIAEKKEKEQKCLEAKTELKEMRTAQFVYTKNDAGEKEILSHEQRAAAEQEAVEKVAHWCGNG